MWELRGCPYCKETHLVNFARPDIEDYVQGELRDPAAQYPRRAQGDGLRRREIAEKELAAKYGVRFTPTIQFFPERRRGPCSRQPDKREVLRAPGYLRPDDFLALFRYVREKGYETKSFRDYLQGARS